MRYTNLQAGRFVAAAAVLVFHAGHYSQEILGLANSLVRPVPAYYFRTAVIFFFALSGFVLALGLQKATLAGFATGRLLRLFPAHWLAVAVVWLGRGVTGTTVPYDNRGLLHALTLWPAGPHRSAYTLGVEWTLVYELFLSLALVPFAALGRRRGLGIGAGLWLGAIVASQVANGGREFVQFPKPGQLPLAVMNAAFLLGVLVYLSQEYIVVYHRAALVLAAVCLIAGAGEVEAHVGWSLLWQSLGTAAAVAAFAGGNQLPERNQFVRAGDWSYGIYLMHVPVLVAFYTASNRLGLSPSWLIAGAGVVVALLLSSTFGVLEWNLYRRLRTRRNGLKLVVVPSDVPAPRRAA